jgi:hypothetical protein
METLAKLVDLGRGIVRALDTLARWAPDPRTLIELWRAVRETLGESLSWVLVWASAAPRDVSAAHVAALLTDWGSARTELVKRALTAPTRGPCPLACRSLAVPSSIGLEAIAA